MRRLLVLLAVSWFWLVVVHVPFSGRRAALVAPLTRQLQAADREGLRRTNPEWDLMARTFTVLAFLNQHAQQPALLADVDRILDDTLARDAQGHDAFVLPYFHRKPFADPATRSLFVDGELALMLASRLLVAPGPQYEAPLRVRIDRLTAAMQRGPVLSAESYPDEAWTFCNTIALAATRVADVVDGRDHSALRAAWVAVARQQLVDADTGLLISSYAWDGTRKDGPEGSTLFLAAHMLQLVDAPFAAEQYVRARRHLAGQAFGFAWAAEWPRAAPGQVDVDSGPTVPLLDANAGASGLALVGAAAFHDDAYLDGLVASLRFGAFPVQRDGRLTFAAGNTLADAVLLYALTEGPLWARVREGQS